MICALQEREPCCRMDECNPVVVVAGVPDAPVWSPTPTEDCAVPIVITTHAGRPPLLPSSFEQAKLWLPGRPKIKLGREWTLKRFRDGFLLMNGKRMANAFKSGGRISDPILGEY